MGKLADLLGAFGLVLLATGCVLSVEPVISESDATFDPRIVGNWKEESGSDSAVIARMGQSGYAIQYTSGGKTGKFEARLGRLGDRLVLDAWPTPGQADLPDPYTGVLIAGHVLLSLDVTPDQIRVSPLDSRAMLKAVRAGEVGLPYSSTPQPPESGDDAVILLAATSHLRAELSTYIARPGAFSEPSAFRRTTARLEIAKGETTVFSSDKVTVHK